MTSTHNQYMTSTHNQYMTSTHNQYMTSTHNQYITSTHNHRDLLENLRQFIVYVSPASLKTLIDVSLKSF